MELASVARFLAQPTGSSGEWFARAQRVFPDPAQKRAKDLALIYAYLADKHYQAAAQILRPIYDQTSPTADNSLPVLLAWAELHNGRNKEAAGLLAFNPLPPSSGIAPFSAFYFPRLFFLRGKVAQLAASPGEARTQFQLFRQLSGPQPLAWGEEAQAN
jgi:hypothetical protein